MMKKLIAYDLDGTLVDTRKDIILGTQHMLRALGLRVLSGDEIERCVGKGLFHLVGSAMGTSDQAEMERGAKILRDYYKNHLMDHTALYSNARAVLEHFKDRIQVVVTNKPDPFSTKILTELGVIDYLSGVYTGADGIPRKPDPQVFHHLGEKHRVSPDEILFLGDSIVDFETGKNARIETVLMRHGFSGETNLEDLKPDYLVDHFDDFLDLAKQKNW